MRFVVPSAPSEIAWDLVSEVCQAFPGATVVLVGMPGGDCTLPTEPNFEWMMCDPASPEGLKEIQTASCLLLPFVRAGITGLASDQRAGVPAVYYVPGERYGAGGAGAYTVHKRSEWLRQVRIALGTEEPAQHRGIHGQ